MGKDTKMNSLAQKVRLLAKRGNNHGIAGIYLALLLVVIFSFVALAIDIGYMYIVKTELQNAADSGALAGAGVVYPKGPLAALPPPDWANARAKALAFVQQNKSTGINLIFANISTGYWNLNQQPPGIQSTGIIPKGKCSTSAISCTKNADCADSSQVCLMQDVPAVKVTINRATDQNGGPVQTFFGRIFGINLISIGSSAVAITGSPNSIPAGGAFPFVLSSCVINDYFSQNPLPNPPTTITDVSLYHTKQWGDVSPGQWTDLQKDKSPSANLLKNYIDNMIDSSNGTPAPPVQTGDPIWIDPGTKAAVYHSTQDLIDAGKGLVIMPVVGTSANCTIVPNTDMVVQGFVVVRLLSTTNHSMSGQFVGYYQANPGSHPGGPITNTAIPPILVK